MPVDDALRAAGFRRWYERQLIESHAWLVTAFLALIMMAVALEAADFDGSFVETLVLVLIAGAGGALVLFAFRRFRDQMTRAEALAAQAECNVCHAYGRFEVLQGRDSSESVSGRQLRVRCRRCAHEWHIG